MVINNTNVHDINTNEAEADADDDNDNKDWKTDAIRII
jgi:hypothetical protein